MAAMKELLTGVTPANIIERAALAAGWGGYDTGGGCMALRFPDESVRAPEFPHYLATSYEAHIPEWGEPIDIGQYLDEDDDGAEVHFRLQYSADCDGLGTAGYTLVRMSPKHWNEPMGETLPDGERNPLDGIACVDPMVSSCGRFDVDPVEAWKVPRPVAQFTSTLYRLAQEVGDAAAPDATASEDDRIVADAVDAMFLSVQNALGVTEGGYAATVWGGDIQDALGDFLRNYIAAERRHLAEGWYVAAEPTSGPADAAR